MHQLIQIDAFASFTLAILLLFIGKGLAGRIAWLRHYGIPEPVVGGVFCAAIVCVLYYGFQITVDFVGCLLAGIVLRATCFGDSIATQSKHE